MARERGLGDAQLLVVPESALEEGRLPAAALAPVRAWLDELATDAEGRAGLVRRTLTGALDSLPRRVGSVERAVAEQAGVADALRDAVDRAYADALEEIDEAVHSGALLRGEVLARWHEVVGTGDLMRGLEARLSRVRERLRAAVTGTPAPQTELQAAVRASVDAVVHAAADRAAERAAGAWRDRPAGRALLAGGRRLDAASPELLPRTRDEVRAWQGDVFDLVSREAGGRRTTARLASFGVNGAGLVVMLAVFAQTGGLTGAEAVVAGGTSVAGQRVLEALLGDQAVRSLADRSRGLLLQRTRGLLTGGIGALLRAARPRRPRARRGHAPAPQPRGDRVRPVSGSLDRRLQALAEAVALADGRLEPAAVEDARGVVRRAGERLGHGLDATVVALAGPTGAGKSTLFNLLAGGELSRTGVRRPTTAATIAAVGGRADPGLLDWLDVRSRHALDAGAPDGLVLLDLPDFDSVEAAHRAEVDRLVQMVDLLVWVVDPQKYADAALHERYLRPLAGHAAAMLVVLNQVDLLGGRTGAARDDLRGLLRSADLGEVPVLAVSARTGRGRTRCDG